MIDEPALSNVRSHHDTVVTREAPIPIVTKTKMYWNAEKSFCENVFRSSTNFLRLLQNRVQATHVFLEDDDLGWGAPGHGDDLGWGGEVTRDAQGCGGGPSPLGLLERDITQEFVKT